MTKTIVDEERSFRGSVSSGTKRRSKVKPCDSCPMPIVLPVLWSYKVTEL